VIPLVGQCKINKIQLFVENKQDTAMQVLLYQTGPDNWGKDEEEGKHAKAW